MPNVRMPNGDVVAFPDNMPPDQIKALIQKKFPQLGAPQAAAPVAQPAPQGQVAQTAMNVGQANPPDPNDTYLSQGLSGLNEGMANITGFPVDLATLAMNGMGAGSNALFHTNFGQIEKPFGGSDSIKSMLGRAIAAPSADPGKQITRRISQEVGAMLLPGAGPIARSARPLEVLGKELLASTGSGTGAALAQQVAPGNPLAEFAGQMVGGLTPSGIARALKGKGAASAAPTIDDLRTAKNAAYKATDDAGVAYNPQAYDKLMAGIVDASVADHISPDRHKAAYSLLVDMIGRRGKPVSLTQLDQLRQEVRRDLVTPSYGSPAAAADAHFGQIMLDKIDDFIDGAKATDVISGDASTGAAAITKARDLNTRLRKTETISDALYKAKLQTSSTGSGGNINNAIRQQIKSILTNPKKAKAFTADERAMMEDLVKQGPTESLLRWVGKFAPGGNGLIGLLEVGATVHNPALAAVPVAGLVAKGIADRGTMAKALKLQGRVARGGPAAVTKALPSKQQIAMGRALMLAQGANQNTPLKINVPYGAAQ